MGEGEGSGGTSKRGADIGLEPVFGPTLNIEGSGAPFQNIGSGAPDLMVFKRHHSTPWLRGPTPAPSSKAHNQADHIVQTGHQKAHLGIPPGQPESPHPNVLENERSARHTHRLPRHHAIHSQRTAGPAQHSTAGGAQERWRAVGMRWAQREGLMGAKDMLLAPAHAGMGHEHSTVPGGMMAGSLTPALHMGARRRAQQQTLNPKP